VADSPCSAGCRVCGGSRLDLLDVGVAIASDNVSSVQVWISEQLIYKPSAAQLLIGTAITPSDLIL